MEKGKLVAAAKEKIKQEKAQKDSGEVATRPTAYAKLLELQEILEVALEDSKGKDKVFQMLSVTRELRGVIETSLKVWETQKRIEAEYAQESPLEASIIYRYLKANYPKALEGLVAHLREVHQGQS